MNEPNYEQILKNQDIISQLTLEEVNNLQRLLDKREYQLKAVPPEKHILDNPDNIKVSKRKFIDDILIPRVEYVISVNQEAVKDHKVLWRQYHIDNSPSYFTIEKIDKNMDNDIFRWIEEKLVKCYNEEEE
jgi:hypothetical protein